MSEPREGGPGVEAGARARARIEIHGAVQGVGFRPAVYRLAVAHDLAGWVLNDTRGVFVEVEGPRRDVQAFVDALPEAYPPLARVLSSAAEWLEPAGYGRFEIRRSDAAGERHVIVLPDVATCDDCRDEVLDPRERRHRYPFTNCTNCGPRFTIVRALPYDRPNTTMAAFPLCPRCRAEYEEPLDRRFHAQPIACADCGPSLELWSPDGVARERGDAALRAAADAIAAGAIVAVKGLGGFHLVCDAGDDEAVARLRERKARVEKPFAVMVRDLEQADALVELSPAAEAALRSTSAPIVLLPRRADAPVSPLVAPGLATLGVMLPATPLHHLLMAALPGPVVATSGNRSDEPIAFDERDALDRLGGFADLFLVHDRPIERHCDDSVGWLMDGGFTLLRRARGFAPLPVQLASDGAAVLAVGPHLKNTVALAIGRQAFLSQHIGDLETPEAMAAFERVIADLSRLYDARPAVIACDLHPDYLSTQWAERATAERGVRLVRVQHHHAHLAACLAEHGEPGRALGVVWDGTGYGVDGTIWGGEWLLGDAAGFERVGHLAPFRLPGGDAAVREPRRTALALLHGLLGDAALERDDLAVVASFRPAERAVLAKLLATGAHAPVTTSAGRLFDGLAALLGLGDRVSYEGQAAIALEFAADAGPASAYPLASAAGAGVELDWRPLLAAVLEDLAKGVQRGVIAARIHATLAASIVATARSVGEQRVVLSGGCFQNRRLTEAAARGLREAGFEVLLHRLVPPNDGGVSLGQAAVARRSGA